MAASFLPSLRSSIRLAALAGDFRVSPSCWQACVALALLSGQAHAEEDSPQERIAGPAEGQVFAETDEVTVSISGKPFMKYTVTIVEFDPPRVFGVNLTMDDAGNASTNLGVLNPGDYVIKIRRGHNSTERGRTLDSISFTVASESSADDADQPHRLKFRPLAR